MIGALLLCVVINANPRADAYVMSFGSDGQSFYMVNESIPRLQEIKKRYGSDFLWARRDGRAYVIRDRALLSRVSDLFEPQRALEPEVRQVSKEESKLDHEIDSLEDRDEDDRPLTSAERERLHDLKIRYREVERREKELDDRQEELERQAERQLWRMIDRAIHDGVAVRE